jgi:hypothetical protein
VKFAKYILHTDFYTIIYTAEIAENERQAHLAGICTAKLALINAGPCELYFAPGESSELSNCIFLTGPA